MQIQMYNILWIDDEHDSPMLSALQNTAIDNDVKLYGFRSLAGIDELEQNYSFYDGILLDAKFYEKEDDQLDSEDTEHIHRAKERILALQKKFKIFVLTGEKEAFDNQTFCKAFKNVYQKGTEETLENLFPDMIAAAIEQVDTQIRSDYGTFFKYFIPEKYGMDSYVSIMEILKLVKSGTTVSNDLDYYTRLRAIVEICYRNLNHVGILHDDCIPGGKVNLYESLKFISGADTKYITAKCTKRHVPVLIEDCFRRITNTVGAVAHTSDGDENKRNIEDLRKYVKSPYYLYSLTYSLMDAVIWTETYIRQNPDLEANRSYWQTIDSTTPVQRVSIGGLIEQDGLNNYHCEGVLLNYNYVKNNNFNVGDEIEILAIDQNSNSRNNDCYKTFAVKFKKT